MFRRLIVGSWNKKEHKWQMDKLNIANKARNTSELLEIAQNTNNFQDVRNLAWLLYNAIQEEDGIIVVESMDEETTYEWGLDE